METVSSSSSAAPEKPAASNRWLDQATAPIATTEGSNHIVRYVNPAFCRWLERPAESFLGKPFGTLLPQMSECVPLLDRVYRTQIAETHSEQHYSKADPAFWSYALWPMMGENKSPGLLMQINETTQFHQKSVALSEALLFGSVRQHQLFHESENLNARLRVEMAERALAKAALRESEARYHNLFNSIDEGFSVMEVIFDTHETAVDLLFSEVNPSFAHQTGLRDVTGKRMSELGAFHEPTWLQVYGEVAGNGVPVSFVCEAKSLNRWFEVYTFRIEGPGSRKIAAIFNDITERKGTEEALQLAQAQLAEHAKGLEGLVAVRTSQLTAATEQMETFVYSIAHDLRAPLRSLQGYTALLLESAAGLNATGQTYATRINKSAHFMGELVSDLLAFSRISQEQVELTAVPLLTVIDSVIGRLEDDFAAQKARLETPGPWPSLRAHEATLIQVVFNLVSNALKFASKNVPLVVRLRTEELGDRVRVWVEDNGIGIAPAHQAQIFGLFTRLHGEKYEGTGIGLAIVQKGLERMGGRVGLESTAGQGCRFWFELHKA